MGDPLSNGNNQSSTVAVHSGLRWRSTSRRLAWFVKVSPTHCAECPYPLLFRCHDRGKNDDGLRLARLRPGRDGVGHGLPGVGDFDPGQPVPKDFPDRTALAYAAAAFMLVAGAAVEWRRTAAWGAAALTAYYALIVVILMNGRVVLAHYAEFGTYSGVAEQLAIAAGGLIVYAASAKIDAALAARLTRLGQLAFGVCALLFGGAHFSI